MDNPHRALTIQKGGAGGDLRGFLDALRDSTAAIERAAIPWALIGGLASAILGRPRHTLDIDIMVRPQDAERALDVLDAAGFRTERTDARWIFKGFRDELTVDVIFKVRGDIYLDEV